jgi:hypothetical protein
MKKPKLIGSDDTKNGISTPNVWILLTWKKSNHLTVFPQAAAVHSPAIRKNRN